VPREEPVCCTEINTKEVMAMNVIDLNVELLKAMEVARLLGIGRTKVYELMSAGELPVVRIGRFVRVPRRSLAAWIDSHTENSGAAW